MTKIFDQGRDFLDTLTHDQTDRTGTTCERIARSLKRGVAPRALAEQLTANQQNNNTVDPEIVTEQDILSAAKLYRINRRRQAYPQTVAAELEKIASGDYFPEGSYPR